MLKETRLKKIYEILQREGSVEINALCHVFGVTNMTLRRDLDSLAQKYDIIRTHGGAMLAEENRISEPPYEKRVVRYEEQKEDIAKKALSFVKQGQKIFIDSGTTTFYIAKEMQYDDRNTVVTNGINIAAELLNRDAISVLLIGGDLEKNTRSTRGALAEEQMRQFKIEIAFLGANAVDENGFVYVGNTSETGFKKRVMENATNTYVLVDSSKFNKNNLISYTHGKDISGIITDSNLQQETYRKLKDNGINIIIAE